MNNLSSVEGLKNLPQKSKQINCTNFLNSNQLTNRSNNVEKIAERSIRNEEMPKAAKQWTHAHVRFSDKVDRSHKTSNNEMSHTTNCSPSSSTDLNAETFNFTLSKILSLTDCWLASTPRTRCSRR